MHRYLDQIIKISLISTSIIFGIFRSISVDISIPPSIRWFFGWYSCVVCTLSRPHSVSPPCHAPISSLKPLARLLTSPVPATSDIYMVLITPLHRRGGKQKYVNRKMYVRHTEARTKGEERRKTWKKNAQQKGGQQRSSNSRLVVGKVPGYPSSCCCTITKALWWHKLLYFYFVYVRATTHLLGISKKCIWTKSWSSGGRDDTKRTRPRRTPAEAGRASKAKNVHEITRRDLDLSSTSCLRNGQYLV